MKRETKFRGKRPLSGKWISGYLFEKDGFAWILSDKFPNPECSCEVLLDTVGEFTGLKDKNGAEIYEGDVLKVEYDDKVEETGMGSYSGIVIFENGMFVCREIGFDYRYELPDCVFEWVKYNPKVIGNIHKTQGLIKN